MAGQLNFDGPVTFNGATSLEVNSFDATSSPYAIVSTSDQTLAIDTSAGAVILNLPGQPFGFQDLLIKDVSGNAAANNITLNATGGLIFDDGTTVKTIDSTFGWIHIAYLPTDSGDVWAIIGVPAGAVNLTGPITSVGAATFRRCDDERHRYRFGLDRRDSD